MEENVGHKCRIVAALHVPVQQRRFCLTFWNIHSQWTWLSCELNDYNWSMLLYSKIMFIRDTFDLILPQMCPLRAGWHPNTCVCTALSSSSLWCLVLCCTVSRLVLFVYAHANRSGVLSSRGLMTSEDGSSHLDRQLSVSCLCKRPKLTALVWRNVFCSSADTMRSFCCCLSALVCGLKRSEFEGLYDYPCSFSLFVF